MILYRLISWPYVKKHALRSLLTIASSVIGVAVFFAMHAANQSVLNAFEETVRRIAGATQLQITAGEPGFGEEVLERVQSLSEVAVAAPVVEAIAGTGLAGEGNLLILGVDLTGDRRLRDYQLEDGDQTVMEDPLIFLAQPDSLIVTSEYARRNHLGINSRVRLETVNGAKEFVVRGTLKAGGFASAFGGNLAVMDVYAAQQVFQRGNRFDRIDVALAKNVSLQQGQQALRELLGPGFQVQTPASRGQSFQSTLRIYYFMLNFSSFFALAVGMFITYSSFSIAVIQRRKEIGILRALGATRRQIVILFLGESALGGLLGAAGGLLAGYAAAGILTRTIGGILQSVYGVMQESVALSPRVSLVMLTISLGVLTSIVAALSPARSAARVDPVQALKKGTRQRATSRPSQARQMASVLLAVAGFALLISTRSLVWFYSGYLSVLLSALLLTPALARALARALRPILSWLRPVEGTLAADSLIGSGRQTAMTVSALMLSVALVIGLAGTARASYNNIMGWVSAALNPDFFVGTSPTLTGNSYRFPNSMTAELAAIGGVDEVYRVRTPRIEYQGKPVLLVVIEMERRGQRSPPPTIAGNPATMYRAAGQGRGVIGSENFASLRGLKVGDQIELPTPAGVLHLPLLGIVREYGDLEGEVMLDWSLFQKYWNDDSVDQFRVFVKAGTEPATVREAILRKFSKDRRLFVLSNRELRDYIASITGQWFGITWVQISVAILVAILGIVNSLTVTIADRRRELGVLRAVGAFRTQIRLTIWLESLGLASIGLILGLALGAIHLYYMLELAYRDFPGLRFDYRYPYEIAFVLFPILLIAALLSAVGPAEAAVRGSLVEALEYE